MNRSLQAVYERGVLRPLEPLELQEHQEVTVTVSDEQNADLADHVFLRYLEEHADDSVTIEEVHSALGSIEGSMLEDFRSERNE